MTEREVAPLRLQDELHSPDRPQSRLPPPRLHRRAYLRLAIPRRDRWLCAPHGYAGKAIFSRCLILHPAGPACAWSHSACWWRVAFSSHCLIALSDCFRAWKIDARARSIPEVCRCCCGDRIHEICHIEGHQMGIQSVPHYSRTQAPSPCHLFANQFKFRYQDVASITQTSR